MNAQEHARNKKSKTLLTLNRTGDPRINSENFTVLCSNQLSYEELRTDRLDLSCWQQTLCEVYNPAQQVSPCLLPMWTRPSLCNPSQSVSPMWTRPSLCNPSQSVSQPPCGPASLGTQPLQPPVGQSYVGQAPAAVTPAIQSVSRLHVLFAAAHARRPCQHAALWAGHPHAQPRGLGCTPLFICSTPLPKRRVAVQQVALLACHLAGCRLPGRLPPTRLQAAGRRLRTCRRLSSPMPRLDPLPCWLRHR